MSLIAMEWGFRAHEKGMNLEMATRQYQELLSDQTQNSLLEDPRFTDEDKSRIIECIMDEIRDCLKDSAIEQAEKEPLIELISYADGDPELTANVLQSMSLTDGPKVNGEFLRVHDDDDENYAETLDFAKRMKLITEDEETVTELGTEYMGRWL